MAGNVALFEIQRSQTSTADAIRFTANIGVVSGRLLEKSTDMDVSRATSGDAHLGERLGAFLPEREDRWWMLDEHTEPDAVLAELSPLIEGAVAFLAENVSDAQLVNLWRTGCPYLSIFQRQSEYWLARRLSAAYFAVLEAWKIKMIYEYNAL